MLIAEPGQLISNETVMQPCGGAGLGHARSATHACSRLGDGDPGGTTRVMTNGVANPGIQHSAWRRAASSRAVHAGEGSSVPSVITALSGI